MPEVVSTARFLKNKGEIINRLADEDIVFVANEKKSRKSFIAVTPVKYINDARLLGRENEAMEVEKLLTDIDERITIRYKEIRSKKKPRVRQE